ncbi:hypothetical protein [Paludisphaera sp.]|uniref:hypothetical protein n=1 Tax=Paludisphaera sp. TaxID=2017432 RepID=UPI00301D0365
MTRPIAAAVAALLILGVGHSPAQDDAPLGLGDLAAEHAALSGRDDPGPAVVASFRDLWERPDEYRGRRVRIVGRVVRTFRQDAVGGFPALVEAWIEQPPGDLLCVVFPAPAGPAAADAWKGATVSFEGTFLRRVRYKAEGDRLAPLIVGPDAPAIEEPAPPEPKETPVGDWPGPIAIVGFIVAMAAVSSALAWRTLSAPAPRRRGRSRGGRIEPGPPPEFLGPEDDHGDPR